MCSKGYATLKVTDLNCSNQHRNANCYPSSAPLQLESAMGYYWDR